MKEGYYNWNEEIEALAREVGQIFQEEGRFDEASNTDHKEENK